MARRICTAKAVLVSLLVVGISGLHYGTQLSEHHYHIFYRELYYLPIILAGFWFGLRGAMATTLGITILYFPFIVMYWQGFSPDDFHQLMELLFCNMLAVVLGALRDRDRARQKQLREMESLAAMGKAISCIAHDMKTPLIAIGGFSRLVQKGLKRDDPRHEKLEIVISETRRLEEMMKDMLDFAKPLELKRCRGCLSGLAVETIELIEEQAGRKGVLIETSFALYLPEVHLDNSKFQRVLQNLIMNAVEASPEGETVTVRTIHDGNKVLIDIVDHGPGIPDDKKEEIFAPFFTTKKEGTGLGLSIARKIVEAHGGRLKILDNDGNGATFRVVLPVHGDPIQETRILHKPKWLNRQVSSGKTHEKPMTL